MFPTGEIGGIIAHAERHEGLPGLAADPMPRNCAVVDCALPASARPQVNWYRMPPQNMKPGLVRIFTQAGTGV
jgi:hypothetical protein